MSLASLCNNLRHFQSENVLQIHEAEPFFVYKRLLRWKVDDVMIKARRNWCPLVPISDSKQLVSVNHPVRWRVIRLSLYRRFGRSMRNELCPRVQMAARFMRLEQNYIIHLSGAVIFFAFQEKLEMMDYKWKYKEIASWLVKANLVSESSSSSLSNNVNENWIYFSEILMVTTNCL